MPRIQTLRKGKNVTYIITIPKAIVEAKGWKKGTELTFKLQNGDLLIQEVK